MLFQEQFQHTLRKRPDFGDICDTRIRNRRQTVRVPVPRSTNSKRQSDCVPDFVHGKKGVWRSPHLVCVTPVFSTFSMCLRVSWTGSTGALHEMKITVGPSGISQGVISWRCIKRFFFAPQGVLV